MGTFADEVGRAVLHDLTYDIIHVEVVLWLPMDVCSPSSSNALTVSVHGPLHSAGLQLGREIAPHCSLPRRELPACQQAATEEASGWLHSAALE